MRTKLDIYVLITDIFALYHFLNQISGQYVSFVNWAIGMCWTNEL
jgi:hypothetical protein